jgi:hypothetical protein
MKKVLIAIDYNPGVQKVAEAGHALAKSLSAGTILLHVVSDHISIQMQIIPQSWASLAI